MGNVIRGEGSSNFSQRIYEKLGFETLLEIQYEDYKQDGEFVFKNTGEHKPEKACSKPLVVSAIDFGTTFSGWAFSFIHEFKSEPTKATVRQWNSGSGTLVTEKTPTSALISPDGKTLVGFGYDAENKYKEKAENGEHWEYYYFRRFKMALNKETISRDFMIEDEMGKRFKAIDVFSMCIAALTDDMIKSGSNTVSGGLTKDDVHWVVTVPAIWSDAAKQFMREAAEMKPASISTEKLSIALEPEAASIFCRHLSVENVKGADTISKLPTGTKYMILDAGGGTIDITIHEVTSTGGLKEVHAASGGGWGGILVDEAFRDVLTDIVGKERYRKFMEQETDDWIDLWRTFEVKKKTIDPTTTAKTNMKIPLSLIEFYKTETRQDLRDRIAETKYASQMKLSGDKIRFACELMQGLFSKSVATTVNHVKSILRDSKARDTKVILMVGGFSDSLILQDAIKREFSNLKIIIPKEASSAILRGAVIFGHNPASISQRALRKTYGIEVLCHFKEGLHDQNYKKITDSGVGCQNIFDKHIERGQYVNVGEAQQEYRYFATHHNQKNIRLPIFASDLKDPMYTDQGCHSLGDITIDISAVPGDLERSVYVSLTFSDTEIKAEGRAEGSDKKVTAYVDFLG